LDNFDFNVDPSIIDEIGPWSERKHGIIQDYAEIATRIMSKAQKKIPRFKYDYIDGFAGTGLGRRKQSNEIVKGSALNSLDVDPAFDSYTFIELDPKKSAMLRSFVIGKDNVEVITGDTNVILPRDVCTRYRFENYRRALCLLDEYTHKHLDWSTIKAIGATRAIDLLLHFPTMPMNRGALRRDGEVSDEESVYMTRFWGDDSWRSAAYVQRDGLLENLGPEKATDAEFAQAFCERLKKVAGFMGTSKPIPMHNRKGATLYYLIFALPHQTALKAAESVAKFFIANPYANCRTSKMNLPWKSVV